MATKTKARLEETIAQQCVAGRLRILNRVVTGIYDDAFRPMGVKTSQLNILITAATRNGAARPADICGLLQMDTSTLSRNVDRMKSNGWLETVPDNEDGRAQPFRLTAKGHKLLQRCKPSWEQAQRKVKKLLGEETIQLLDDAVQRIWAEEAAK